MSKKIIIATIVILIIVLIAIVLFILRYNTDNAKIIYSSSYISTGFIPSYHSLEIYDNGVIKEQEKIEEENKIKTRKISSKELKELKEAIEKVEECNLNMVDYKEYLSKKGLLSMAYNTITYINLNKKIILNNDRYIYDNEEVYNLKNIISNIT